MKNSTKITENTAFIIFMIIFIFPYGLYLMWKNKKFNLRARKVITILYCISCLSIPFAPTDTPTPAIPAAKPIIEESIPEQEEEIPVNTPTIEPELVFSSETVNIEYDLKQIDDVNAGNAIRKDLHIIVNNSDTIKTEDFEKLCRKIVTEYTSSTPVNALTLYFYHDPKEIGKGYTVGMCTYYPNGEIGEAINVATGDYTTFKYTYTFEEKNPSDKPSDEEIEIYNYCNDLISADYTYTDKPSAQELADMYYNSTAEDIQADYDVYLQNYYETKREEDAEKQTAQNFGITVDEVNRIWVKVYSYYH